jgi:hypothetical protein
MPFCTCCRAEYRQGFDTCADCRVPLVSTLPPLPPVGIAIEEVAVAQYRSEPEAAMWVELLKGEGIPSRLIALMLPGLVAYGASEGVPHELRVRAGDADRARELLGTAQT